MSKSDRHIMKEFLRRFDASRTLDSAMHNIFAEKEKKNLIKFKKHNINIPWYLMPFSNMIINIAYISFKNGLSDACTDTVTVRRPAPYKAKL